MVSLQEIEEAFSQVLINNEIKNQAGVKSAFEVYKSRIDKVCGVEMLCLHPSVLDDEHEDSKTLAINEFFSRRRQGGEDGENDQYLNELKMVTILLKNFRLIYT